MTTHQVTFLPMGTTVEVDPDLYPYGREGLPGSLLDIALTHGVQIEHACGGAGACGTCHVIVEQGMDNLSQTAEAEYDKLDALPGTTLRSRLACQAVVTGDVTVRIVSRPS